MSIKVRLKSLEKQYTTHTPPIIRVRWDNETLPEREGEIVIQLEWGDAPSPPIPHSSTRIKKGRLTLTPIRVYNVPINS